MTLRKPQPRYGWWGQEATQDSEIKIGAKVVYRDGSLDGTPGIVLDGPRFISHRIKWRVQWGSDHSTIEVWSSEKFIKVVN